MQKLADIKHIIKIWLKRIFGLFGLPNLMNSTLYRFSPKGLYARAVLIVILPMMILVGILTFIFMQRHFETVTFHLSQNVARNIAVMIDLYEKDPANKEEIEKLATERFGFTGKFEESEPLPPPTQKPFFSSLDRVLSSEISTIVSRPFWIDTIGRSNFVEIRIKLENVNLNIVARRSQTYASNSHIFLIWMAGTGFGLVIISLLFMRNQIKPIQKLAYAAEQFGKGNQTMQITPRGAREVRQATQSFMDMRKRIERQMDQRSIMLAGVSHDLNTYLTRMRLQIELMEPQIGLDDLAKDADDMKHILQDYLEFVRGDITEIREELNFHHFLSEFAEQFQNHGKLHITLHTKGDAYVRIRKNAMHRCFLNIVQNAEKFAQNLQISVENDGTVLAIIFDDDGPGIAEEERERALQPFYRLDIARNLNMPGSGLGLAIARDIIRGHGGELHLNTSPLGGLQIYITLPTQ